MKNYKSHYLYTIHPCYRLIMVIALIICSFNAKSNPMSDVGRATVFKRAKSLDNGVSVSWLEQTWNKDILHGNPLTPSDYSLMKEIGIKSIRLPVAFNYMEAQHIPFDDVMQVVDEVWKQCKKHGFKLIIDNHYGNLTDSNYLTETPKIINLWLKITRRYYKDSYNGLFFDIYNEPANIKAQTWKDAAYNIVTAIRKTDKNRTLLVGAANYNGIQELGNFERLEDENIIYTFHFYEPFFFTHQGAEWVGTQMATTGVPFPYSEKNFPTMNEKAKNTAGEYNYTNYQKVGNEAFIREKLLIAKNWSDKYCVPVLCGEYGAYKKYADLESRCNYIKTMRRVLAELNIPGMMWDYNDNFSIFNGKPSIETLPDCMKDAIGYTAKM